MEFDHIRKVGYVEERVPRTIRQGGQQRVIYDTVVCEAYRGFYVSRPLELRHLLTLQNQDLDPLELIYRQRRLKYPTVGTKVEPLLYWDYDTRRPEKMAAFTQEELNPDFEQGKPSRLEDPNVNIFLALLFSLGKLKRIEAYLLEEGQESTATIEGREWLGDLTQGGGMLFDLMTHLPNVVHVLGFRVDALNEVRLGSHTQERGVYIPIGLHDWITAEDFAKACGTTMDGVPFEFVVGKYAKAHNRYVLLEDEKGMQLKLSFTWENLL